METMSAIDRLFKDIDKYTQPFLMTNRESAKNTKIAIEQAAAELAALKALAEQAEIEKINKYYDGVIDGVFAYAWYADGGMQVGTSGKTFTEAKLEIEQDRAIALSNIAAALKREK